jgi:hypothetical protein
MVLPAAVLGNPGFTPSAGRWSIRLFGVEVYGNGRGDPAPGYSGRGAAVSGRMRLGFPRPSLRTGDKDC